MNQLIINIVHVTGEPSHLLGVGGPRFGWGPSTQRLPQAAFPLWWSGLWKSWRRSETSQVKFYLYSVNSQQKISWRLTCRVGLTTLFYSKLIEWFINSSILTTFHPVIIWVLYLFLLSDGKFWEKSGLPDTSTFKYKKSRSLSTPMAVTGAAHIHTVLYIYIIFFVYV